MGVEEKKGKILVKVLMLNGSRKENRCTFTALSEVARALNDAGTTAALDSLNKYFAYAEMPIVSSRYWNMVHGFTADDVRADEEGMQIMRILGRNMAWLLKSIEAGKKNGLKQPPAEEKVFTNFIK